MRKKLIIILLLLSPASLVGQVTSSQVISSQVISSGLTVNTSPSGAEIILEGDVTVNGFAPLGFPGELQGEYKLTIMERGFETLHQTLYLYQNRPLDLTFSLKPKTRFKAALRSLIIPGWGQMYSGRTGRGILYTVLTAGATGYYFIANDDFNDKYDEYKRLSYQYNRAGTQAEKVSLYSLLENAKQRAYDAENKRVIAAGSVIGLWGLNLIDALFFFPQRKDDTSVSNLTLTPDPARGGAQIVFSFRF